MLPKKLSLFLSVNSVIIDGFLMLPLDTNGNFPVVGDGCTCSIKMGEKVIQQLKAEIFFKNLFWT